jgi:hypothetical protein
VKNSARTWLTKCRNILAVRDKENQKAPSPGLNARKVGGHISMGIRSAESMRPGSYDWALTLSPFNTRDHGRVAEWTYVAKDKPADVRVLQSPTQAAEMLKTYGDNPRYG